jgi:hypothetical protein
MCVAAALAKAIGIEAESTKRAGRSEAGLAANSPGRRHCPLKAFIPQWQLAMYVKIVLHQKPFNITRHILIILIKSNEPINI